MLKPLRILVVEDSEQDAALLLRELQKAGYSPVHRRVETAREMAEALDGQEWDIVLSDYVLPSFDGLAAVRLVREKGLDIPLIIVSGQIGEDTAVEAMRAGAHDYIMKGNLKRLSQAIKRELVEAENRKLRRLAEEELRAREEELRLAKKMDMIKDEFIGMVSHELKTPLTVIIGALSVATTDGVPEKDARELVRDAIANADALTGIVDNLLELSRHQSSRLTLQAERSHIDQVAQDVIRKLQSRSNMHRLVVDMPPSLPSAVIDRIRIERVLHNLVENAIKYSPDGGEVRVFAQHQDNQLVIGVSDQGTGISPEDQSKLFQRFQRLETNTKHTIPGVGLGLRVCHIIVEAHGGRIWVDSERGRGATFYFTLPAGGDL